MKKWMRMYFYYKIKRMEDEKNIFLRLKDFFGTEEVWSGLNEYFNK